MEVWKKVVNWERLYEVSNLGRVKSVEHQTYFYRDCGRGVKQVSRLVRTRILNPTKHSSNIRKINYIQRVILSKQGFQIETPIWKLVATAFIPNPNNWEFVEWLDRDRLNCSADNLIWTPKLQHNIYKEAERGLR